MPAEIITGKRMLYIINIMHKTKRPDDELRLVYFNMIFFVPAIIKDIMIAFYKINFKCRKIFASFFKKRQFFIGFTVKKISYDYQPFRYKIIDHIHQRHQVRYGKLLCNADASFAECAHLTEMYIRNDQGFLFFPEDRFIGAKPKMLVVDTERKKFSAMFDHKRQIYRKKQKASLINDINRSSFV